MGRFLLCVASVRHKFTSATQVWTAAKRLGLEAALQDCVRTKSLDEVLPWQRRVNAHYFREKALRRAAAL